MSLNFKVSFDLSDFEDNEFLQDLEHVYKFYNNVILLVYKLYKGKICQQYATLEEIHKIIKDNDIQLVI
jgi:hypothetical protein